ncbi:Tripartite tricarboxylate transporter TctA family protein [uncultured archaeon]|nr:Tripartite tricarboxylate transporter TctA family protein [uncultured archaeon]
MFLSIGCVLGTISGITPGLHINTIAAIGLGVYSALSLNGVEYAVIMTSMAVTHAFLDFLPSIYLGVPNEETAYSALPAHRLVLEGRGLKAVLLTTYGGIIGIITSLMLIPIALVILPWVHQELREVMYAVVAVSVAYLVLREKGKRKIAALTVLTLSGTLGLLMFKQTALSSAQMFFPVFSGLFGMANLITALPAKTARIPQEPYARTTLDGSSIKAGVLGSLGGAIVGVLPSMSPGQVAIILYSRFKASTEEFLVSIAAINTSDAIFSFVSLYALGNPRSGVAVAVGKVINMTWPDLLLIVGTAAITVLPAAVIQIKLGRQLNKVYDKVPEKNLNYAAILLVLALVTYFTGAYGVFTLAVATAIGILPIQLGISRTHLMGILVVPTFIRFMGITG